MDDERFAKDRHRPSGDWVQTTPLLKVEGVQHHMSAALAFAVAASKAEQSALHYGIALEPEPQNPHDLNAIKIIGIAATKPLLGAPSERRYHIGYVDRHNAAELTEDLIKPDHPYAGELYGIYRSGQFVDVGYFVLVPKGSPAVLRKAKRRAAPVSTADAPLTEEQRVLLSNRQMGLYRNSRLEQAQALKRLGHHDLALDMFLRVAWLDQQGPNNVGTMNGVPLESYPAFQKTDVFIAPGIISEIGSAVNTLGLELTNVRQRFIASGDREITALKPVQPPVSHTEAWSANEAVLAEAIASGSKWRKPKSTT